VSPFADSVKRLCHLNSCTCSESKLYFANFLATIFLNRLFVTDIPHPKSHVSLSLVRSFELIRPIPKTIVTLYSRGILRLETTPCRPSANAYSVCFHPQPEITQRVVTS
jgi:hypothetical protein